MKIIIKKEVQKFVKGLRILNKKEDKMNLNNFLKRLIILIGMNKNINQNLVLLERKRILKK